MRPDLRLRAAKQSAAGGTNILEGQTMTELDYQQVKSAADQFHQAAKDLYMLAGQMDEMGRAKSERNHHG